MVANAEASRDPFDPGGSAAFGSARSVLHAVRLSVRQTGLCSSPLQDLAKAEGPTDSAIVDLNEMDLISEYSRLGLRKRKNARRNAGYCFRAARNC